MRTPLRFLFLASAFLVLAAPSHPEYACTMDAKLCPDGETYVGRQGPNCEFAPCPGETQACTKELKICPDGTGVGRTGPNCEFEACPETNCSPYVCANGKTHPRCSEDGHVINYFAPPCHMDGGEEGAPFEDVTSDHPNADAIFYVKSQGIVEGYQDGTFKPDTTINRAEFTKIVVVALGTSMTELRACVEENADAEQAYVGYEDVIDAHAYWFTSFVCVATEKGLVSGYPSGGIFGPSGSGLPFFKPERTINFAEAAKILAKSFNLEASTTIPACDGDAYECPWYRSYVLMLEMRAAIPMSIERVGQEITRGEMAEMIYRLKTGNNDKPTQTYGFLWLMETCDRRLRAGHTSCE